MYVPGAIFDSKHVNARTWTVRACPRGPKTRAFVYVFDRVTFDVGAAIANFALIVWCESALAITQRFFTFVN